MKFKLTNFYGNAEQEHLVNTVIRTSGYNFINTGFFENDIKPVIEAIKENENYLLGADCWNYSKKEKQQIIELINSGTVEEVANFLADLRIENVYVTPETETSLHNVLDSMNFNQNDLRDVEYIAEKVYNFFEDNGVNISNRQSLSLANDYVMKKFETIVKSVEPNLVDYGKLVLSIGEGFHPDTPIEDYQINGQVLYSNPKEIKALNTIIDNAFIYCQENDLDIYEISMLILNLETEVEINADELITKEFGKPNKLGADWGVTSWTIKGDDEDGWFIVDNENGTYSYTNKVWNEEDEQSDYNDVYTVDENKIQELIDYVKTDLSNES